MMDSVKKTTHSVQTILKGTIAILSANGIEKARLEAELLLSHVLKVRKEDLIIYPGQELTAEQEERFGRLVERRCRKEPLAYILGDREFWSLTFQVDPNVLIPRPETEGIIERLLSLAGPEARLKPVRILDVGTGSGILAIVSAVEFVQARVTAVDISEVVLETARGNARRHQVADRINFLQMDLMQNWILPENETFDFILSNPPYIPSKDIERLMPDIRNYEPQAALDGGPDGLNCYRSIVPNAFSCLNPGGHLIVEVGDGQSEAVKNILHDHGGFEDIEIVKDLSGRDRIVSAGRVRG
ncbi:MAG: peptide chain release factor N(5)-glutamine methyltransferase [Nitrospinota bacterium]|nr:peptide chain release factor N(5)-glutamine methyltransferase [Nitrospinota bacterium]